METIDLVDNTDAMAWVEEWLRIVNEEPSIATDRATMIGWFANAIMAGYDAGYRKGKQPIKRPFVKIIRYSWGFDVVVKFPKIRRLILTFSNSKRTQCVYLSRNGTPGQAMLFLWPLRYFGRTGRQWTR